MPPSEITAVRGPGALWPPRSWFLVLGSWLLPLCCPGAAEAQAARGDVTVAVTRNSGVPGGFHRLDRIAGTLVPLQNQPAVLAGMTALCPSPWVMDRFFAAASGLTGPVPSQSEVYEVHAAQGAVTAAFARSAQPLPEVFLGALLVVGDHVYCQGQTAVHRVHLGTGGRELVRQYGTGEGPYGMASDGRWLYLGLGPLEVRRLNLLDFNDVRPLSQLPGVLFEVLMALAMHPDGSLVAATGNLLGPARLYRIDPVGGAVLQSVALPFGAVRALAVDPASGEMLISGTSAPGPGSVVMALPGWNAALLPIAAFAGEATLALRRSSPLHRSGPPCPAANGEEPRITANRPPDVGAADYAIAVHSRPGRAAILLGGARPPPTTPFAVPVPGFPGCVITVNVGATAFAVLDSAGSAAVAIPVPNAPALRDAAVDFQWLVLDAASSGALHLAVTQTGTAVVD